MRLWMLMVYSLVTTSLMAERPFFFSPPFFAGAIYSGDREAEQRERTARSARPARPKPQAGQS